MLATNTIIYENLNPSELNCTKLQTTLIEFLYRQLGKFRDPQEDIRACLDYILTPGKGGHVIVARNDDKQLLGVLLMVKSKMKSFVPEYLLVYLATSSKHRGQGIGSQLISFAQNTCRAPIALHVEHENPAKKLYQRLGFTSKYAEMRWGS